MGRFRLFARPDDERARWAPGSPDALTAHAAPHPGVDRRGTRPGQRAAGPHGQSRAADGWEAAAGAQRGARESWAAQPWPAEQPSTAGRPDDPHPAPGDAGPWTATAWPSADPAAAAWAARSLPTDPWWDEAPLGPRCGDAPAAGPGSTEAWPAPVPLHDRSVQTGVGSPPADPSPAGRADPWPGAPGPDDARTTRHAASTAPGSRSVPPPASGPASSGLDAHPATTHLAAKGPLPSVAMQAAGLCGPPTDPVGFPAVDVRAEHTVAAWRADSDASSTGNGPGGAVIAAPHTASAPPGLDPAVARAVAAAFAADYLSWDEDDPARRGDALADHLPEALARAVRGGPGPGWSGEGRQRSELALPGALHDDSSDARLLVDVRVRVTPYVRRPTTTAAPAPPATAGSALLGTPAAAPAPTAPGWTGLPARWVRLGVPVRLDGDRPVVDPDEELLGPPAAERPAAGTP